MPSHFPNQNVEHECFHCAFQIFHIFVGSVYLTNQKFFCFHELVTKMGYLLWLYKQWHLPVASLLFCDLLFALHVLKTRMKFAATFVCDNNKRSIKRQQHFGESLLLCDILFVRRFLKREGYLCICTGPLFTKRTDVLKQDLAKSRSREIRLIIIVSLCNLTGISAALLPRCLSNSRAIGNV